MGETQTLEPVLCELPENPGRAARAVERAGGAGTVARAARRLGLAALIHHFLPDLFPLPRADRLAAQFKAAQTLRTTIGFLETFEEAGIRCAVLKGVGVARYYPELWMRPSVDVDVLVGREDLERASSLVLGLGWSQSVEAPREPLDFGHDCVFVGPQKQMLELHFTPSWHFQSRFDVAALLSRADRVAVGGSSVRALGVADNLVHQCVHAAQHFFEGGKWLFDLKLQALAGPPWPEFVERARESRVAAVTGVTLEEARRRVQLPVPEWVLRELRPSAPRRLLARVAGRISEAHPRIRSGAFDVLLPDGLTRDWLLRWAAPPIKRARRLRHAVASTLRRESAAPRGSEVKKS